MVILQTRRKWPWLFSTIITAIKCKSKIVEIIGKGVEQGEFRPDVDQTQFALSIIALIESGVMIANLPGIFPILTKF
jgi:hypothetical protein